MGLGFSRDAGGCRKRKRGGPTLAPLDQELVIPAMIPKLTRKPDEVQQAGVKSFPIKAMQDDRNSLVNAGRYFPPTDSKPAPQPAAIGGSLKG